MQLERKKVRLPRVERSEDVSLEDHENLGWAVSYSDLLMVLMSFFVIFFAANKGKKDQVFSEVAVALGQNVTGSDKLGKGDGLGPEAKKGVVISKEDYAKLEQARQAFVETSQKVSDDITDSLNAFGVEVDETAKPYSLTINLPDDVYPKLGFNLTSDMKKMIDQIFSSITPHQEKIAVHFIGHSDSAPIRGGASPFLTSNYTLSSLRAAKALEYSLATGFPSQQLFAQGGAEHSRDSRTLSIRLVMRPADKSPAEDVAH